jgi:predicted dehydrogenase
MSEVTRRDFMKDTAAVSAGAAVGLGAFKRSTAAWAGANEKIRVACIGIRGQGKGHIKNYAGREDVEVATLCDVDERLFEERLKEIFDDQGKKRPGVETDMRRVMDDDSIDCVSIATPNHWHSLAAIWAIQAGKDVYVEKPCSHNIFEGRRLVEEARKHNRVVQHGTQIRSSAGIREAVQKLQEGVIGEVYMARGLCYRWRPSIGTTPVSDVPPGVHYDLWLGPAPESPFSENRFHYNWHYMWDYGNGDIGNQGVHQMDVARWGLGVTLPKRVLSGSGMFIYDDDKEVPNVINTTFEFPDDGPHGKMLVFDTRPYYTNDEKGAKVGVLFYGSEGYMVIDSYDHYQTYLGKDEEMGPGRDEGGDHFGNFLAAVRERKPENLHAEILEGHYSAALCHIGLISARLGRSLEFDPERERFVGDAEANQYLTRVYRKPFVVPGGPSSSDGRTSTPTSATTRYFYG